MQSRNGLGGEQRRSLRSRLPITSRGKPASEGFPVLCAGEEDSIGLVGHVRLLSSCIEKQLPHTKTEAWERIPPFSKRNSDLFIGLV